MLGPNPLQRLKYVLCAAMDLSWESPLQIARYPDPRLRAPNLRIGVFDERLRQLAAEMFEIMYECVARRPIYHRASKFATGTRMLLQHCHCPPGILSLGFFTSIRPLAMNLSGS